MCTPPNTCFLGPTRILNPNGISISSAIFAQFTAECSHTIQWAAPPPPQNCPLPWGIWTIRYMVPLATRVLNPNGVKDSGCISIGCAVFAGLTTVTDRWTDRQTILLSWKTIGRNCRIYVRSTAMRPNNNTTRPPYNVQCGGNLES